MPAVLNNGPYGFRVLQFLQLFSRLGKKFGKFNSIYKVYRRAPKPMARSWALEKKTKKINIFDYNVFSQKDEINEDDVKSKVS